MNSMLKSDILHCCPKVVFLDLDGTIWSSLDISSSIPPYTKLSDNAIKDSRGEVIVLRKGFRDFIKWLRNSLRHVRVYTLSWNIPWKALEALKAFGIVDLFDGHCIEYHPHKELMMKKALVNEGLRIRPCEILYIDDRTIHLSNIRELIGDVAFIHMGYDVKDFIELRKLLESVVTKLCQI